MIRVGFSCAKGFWSFLSWIIRKATGRPYSHVWLLLTEEEAREFTGNSHATVLQEAEGGGLAFEPWVDFQVGKDIVKLVVPPISLVQGMRALMPKVGKAGYDYAGLVGEGYVLAMRDWLKRKVKNPLRNPKDMWCSEAVAYAMEKSNYPMAPDSWKLAMPPDVDDGLTAAAFTGTR